MDQWGISRSVLSTPLSRVHFGDDEAARDLARQVNDSGADIVRAHPARFGHFDSLPFPDVDGSLTELSHALDELGCDGVTIESNRVCSAPTRPPLSPTPDSDPDEGAHHDHPAHAHC